MIDLIFQIFITTVFLAGLFVAYKCGRSDTCSLNS